MHTIDNEDIPLKPLTDYENYVDDIRKETKILGERIIAGEDPNVVVADYNKAITNLQNNFIPVRIKDYKSVRDVEKGRFIEAEAESIDIGKPRPPATVVRDDYRAPGDMEYWDAKPGTITDHGDTDNGPKIEILEQGKLVKFTISARSQHKPNGGTHIAISPVITWSYSENIAHRLSYMDFETLQLFADDKLFKKYWK
ncbi:hypothetical protein ACFVSS_25185 [Peribacillus butanolivorans]|uniref:hypothetical protein n=1 Tax=Peribacillus butanolivorans TaxID=421767 RepID=UPI0036DDAF71